MSLLSDAENIRIENYFYDLPDNRIARFPLSQRDKCKLLVYRAGETIVDETFCSLPDIIDKDSVLICNDSKVINARLRFKKSVKGEGANIEVFCLEPYSPFDYALNMASTSQCKWKCLVGNSKRWKSDTALTKEITIDDEMITLKAIRIERNDDTSIVEFSWNNPVVTFSRILESAGNIPIPPYLHRESCNTDLSDYQTVYSHYEGSVAAPTAGLHFTENLINRLMDKGVDIKHVTLHVGAGTFKPVTSDYMIGHVMHTEFFSVETSLIHEILQWKNGSIMKNIVAVGTTSVRTLESLYYVGCLISTGKWNGIVPQWYPYTDDCPQISLEESFNNILNYYKKETVVGETALMIVPGFRFRIVDALLTNFHQPSSTLLLLVSAFISSRNKCAMNWHEVYKHALDNEYRFLSYGDACLFL